MWLAWSAALIPRPSSLCLLRRGRSLGAVDVDRLPLMILSGRRRRSRSGSRCTRHGLYAIDRLVNRTLVYAVADRAAGRRLRGVSSALGGARRRAARRWLVAVATLVVGARVPAAARARPGRSSTAASPARASRPCGCVRDFLDEVRDGRARAGGRRRRAAPRRSRDPLAEVVFRLPETGAYADAAGELVERAARRRARALRDRPRRRELGVLLHDPALLERRDLLRGVLDAAAVPVELARLRVELRLQLAEVESSRARIVQAGYEERRRLERDLHDGAQQRLVTLGIVLRRLQRSLPREAQILAPALDAASTRSRPRSATCARSPPACARRGSTTASPPRSPTSRARAPVPVEVDATARPRAAGGRGGRLLRRLRGAHQRGQARVAVARGGRETAREDGVLRLRRRRRRRRRRRAVRRGSGLAGLARPRRRPGRDARDREPARRGHADRGGAAVRVVIAEDTVLLREGLAGLLEDAGPRGRRRARATPTRCSRSSREHEPELAIVDVRMPPDYDDEGTRAAAEIRALAPGDRRARALPAHRDAPRRRARQLAAAASATCSRTACSTSTTSSTRRAASPRAAPRSTRRSSRTLIGAPAADRALGELTPREREVLALMAEGRTNAGIAQAAVADREDGRDARAHDPR